MRVGTPLFRGEEVKGQILFKNSQVGTKNLLKLGVREGIDNFKMSKKQRNDIRQVEARSEEGQVMAKSLLPGVDKINLRQNA